MARFSVFRPRPGEWRDGGERYGFDGLDHVGEIEAVNVKAAMAIARSLRNPSPVLVQHGLYLRDLDAAILRRYGTLH